MKSLKTEKPESLDTETYFTFINEMRTPMPKGSQAWNCYGNRTNVFLMVNYGFCFKDNLYDSVKLMMRLDIDFSENKYPELLRMISQNN